MSEQIDSVTTEEPRNWPFWAVKWYGYIFALMFIFYGGLKLVLGALDRVYTDTPEHVVYLVEGLILLGLTMGFKERKNWGWYGMVALNGLVVLSALVTLKQLYNIPFLVLSLAALGTLFSKPVRGEFF